MLVGELCRQMKWLAAAGWFPGSSGNFSIFQREEDRIYIKATGTCVRDMDGGGIVVLNSSGRKIDGTGPPSKEYRFHVGIYMLRKELNALIHGHPPFASAFALTAKEMPMVTTPAKIHLKKVPVVEYASPGSEHLARSVIEAFRNSDVFAVLLKDHGVVCGGRVLSEAVNMAEWIEDNARSVLIQGLMNRAQE